MTRGPGEHGMPSAACTGADAEMRLDTVPVLLYHSVSATPSSWIDGFTVSAETLERHLELIAASGRTPVTVSQLFDPSVRATVTAPVVVTFDDGFADTRTTAATLLDRHRVPATIYLTTGFLGGRSPGGDPMLDWSQAEDLRDAGHEIGAHTVTHPQLDTLPAVDVRREVADSRHRLEDRLGLPVDTFAYPHGYSSPHVRGAVASAGFATACSVKNAHHSSADSRFTIARLTVTPATTDDQVRGWLDPGPHRVGPADDRAAARAWRMVRTTRRRITPKGPR